MVPIQGIFINGHRPKSKKQVKEAVASDPGSVIIEATSISGNEFDGCVDELTICHTPIYFVGPDPYTKRVFYGTIKRNTAGKLVVS